MNHTSIMGHVGWGADSGVKRLPATLAFLRWRRMERVRGLPDSVSSCGLDGSDINLVKLYY